MSAAVKITIDATDGLARAGRLSTPSGSVDTPHFMPVGTRGTVKYLDPSDLERLGAGIVLANTYHLMLRPGAELVARLGGLHSFTGWSGPILTDSGGFQVFSLEPKVDDEGVTFRSVYDGSWCRLTPEHAVHTQKLLGADVQMALDVCPALPATSEVIAQAVERTLAWAERARVAHHDDAQALFGIVQGGTDSARRSACAQNIVAIGFDGYGIGGFSVGETRDEMLPALAATCAALPSDQPRYLMGVGDPASIVEAVALGVDMFDCVLPTRLGRHGTMLTSTGRLNVKNQQFAGSDEPIDPACPCEVCARHSRGYIRHLFQVNEPTAARLGTIHNVAWTFDLMARVRAAIAEGTLARLRSDLTDVWG
ncbi:MAG: tRNA guanosine(34) transglycosylase Tgt [Acidimicrobiales bacterium]